MTWLNRVAIFVVAAAAGGYVTTFAAFLPGFVETPSEKLAVVILLGSIKGVGKILIGTLPFYALFFLLAGRFEQRPIVYPLAGLCAALAHSACGLLASMIWTEIPRQVARWTGFALIDFAMGRQTPLLLLGAIVGACLGGATAGWIYGLALRRSARARRSSTH